MDKLYIKINFILFIKIPFNTISNSINKDEIERNKEEEINSITIISSHDNCKRYNNFMKMKRIYKSNKIKYMY